MNSKQVIGIFALIAGVILVIVAKYIEVQVAEGNLQISSAQKKVNSVNSLFSRNPTTAPIGQGLTSGSQKKINAGQEDVDYYTVIAQRCMFGGVALMVIGAGMVLFFRGSKKKR